MKTWPSRSLHAPCSDALQGTVAEALLPQPPQPLALVHLSCRALHGRHHFLDPCWVEFRRLSLCGASLNPLFSPYSWRQFSTNLVFRMCWKNSTPSCSFVVNVSVGRAALPGDCVLAKLFKLALLPSICHSTNNEVKTWGNTKQSLWVASTLSESEFLSWDYCL